MSCPKTYPSRRPGSRPGWLGTYLRSSFIVHMIADGSVSPKRDYNSAMKMLHLRGLTPSTQALVRKLVSWPPLKQRWAGDGETSEIIMQIGTANEPAAIPSLMSFGLAHNDRIRTEARSVIGHLFSQIPIDFLPVLDESLRRSWGHLEDWYGMKPNVVRMLERSTENDRLFLSLVSCHRNGYVRAEALHALGTESSGIVLPFVLIRLVDWVSEVRSIAENEFRKRLNVAYAHGLVNCLGLVNRLSTSSRYRMWFSLSIEEFLHSPECADALRHGLRSEHPLIRRECFRIAPGNPSTPAKAFVHLALTDADVMVRKWAFTVGPGLLPTEEHYLMQVAAKDSYGPIRRIAFDALVASRTLLQAELTPFLLDRSASIRRWAQAVSIQRLDQSPADIYRNLIHDRCSKKAEVGVLGLAETGRRSDGPAILRMLAHGSARVRRAAVRALRILGVEEQEVPLLRIISSDVRSVVREAAYSLLLRRISAADVVWTAALKNTGERVPETVLRLMKDAGKWQQLRLYLGAARSESPSLSKCAIEMLLTWNSKFNSSFVEPSAAERESSLIALDSVEERLPKPLARELRFTLLASVR